MVAEIIEPKSEVGVKGYAPPHPVQVKCDADVPSPPSGASATTEDILPFQVEADEMFASDNAVPRDKALINEVPVVAVRVPVLNDPITVVDAIFN